MAGRNIVRNEIPGRHGSFRERVLALAGITEVTTAETLKVSLETLRGLLDANRTISIGRGDDRETFEVPNDAIRLQAARVLVSFCEQVIAQGDDLGGLGRAVQIVVNTAEGGRPLPEIKQIADYRDRTAPLNPELVG